MTKEQAVQELKEMIEERRAAYTESYNDAIVYAKAAWIAKGNAEGVRRALEVLKSLETSNAEAVTLSELMDPEVLDILARSGLPSWDNVGDITKDHHRSCMVNQLTKAFTLIAEKRKAAK